MENAAHLKPHGDHLLNYSHVWSTAFVFISVTSALLAFSLSFVLGSNLNQGAEDGAEAWDMDKVFLSDLHNRNKNTSEQLGYCHQTSAVVQLI